MNDKIKEMLEMQKALDDYITKNNGINKIEKSRLQMALIDEIGELTHELKGDWCWWKKTQAPVDNDKVLGELVDIWHFVLSYQNNFNHGEKTLLGYSYDKEIADDFLENLIAKKYMLPIALSGLVRNKNSIIMVLVAITEHIGFTIKQVYEAYCDKNKVNYQRLKEGY